MVKMNSSTILMIVNEDLRKIKKHCLSGYSEDMLKLAVKGNYNKVAFYLYEKYGISADFPVNDFLTYAYKYDNQEFIEILGDNYEINVMNYVHVLERFIQKRNSTWISRVKETILSMYSPELFREIFYNKKNDLLLRELFHDYKERNIELSFRSDKDKRIFELFYDNEIMITYDKESMERMHGVLDETPYIANFNYANVQANFLRYFLGMSIHPLNNTRSANIISLEFVLRDGRVIQSYIRPESVISDCMEILSKIDE